MSEPTSDPKIENAFAYHKPKDDDTANRHQTIRDRLKESAYLVTNLCPESRERSLAITKIEEAMMWANAAIARNQARES